MEKMETLKGLHPGAYLKRELRKRLIPMSRFALSIDEYPQTLHAITKGIRSMNTPLALRIEKALGLEEGFLMTLQIFYDIKQEKRKQRTLIKPDLSKFRPGIFWDVDAKQIDWNEHRRFVIERVFERGSASEKEELMRLYGKQVVEEELTNIKMLKRRKPVNKMKA